MKNIQILVTLKAQVETADFMMEDLATCIDVEDVELDENTYFVKDLIGIRVIDNDTGVEYGTIKDVFQTGANDVYTVKNGEKEYLVPAIADVVVDTDIENKVMRITPLKGLFEDED